MSAQLAIASPRRIKATHRRRRKVTSGPIVQRYYDPQIGRFLSVDPVATDGSTGGNFNRFWYGNDNPYKFTDPDGRVSYLVSRPLDGKMGEKANHNFIVTNAQGLGDPKADVYSYGDVGDDRTGPVSEDTEGMSASTSTTDISAWQSAGESGAATSYRVIDAPDAKVQDLAQRVAIGNEYSLVPEVQGGTNSNSAAGAVAQRADAGAPRVDNGKTQTGTSQAAVNRVPFEPKRRDDDTP